jgi:ParB family chromosome partitioning protein
VAQDDSVVKEISVANITANPYQPRKHFDVDKLQELADSIKVHGLIQPLIVSVKAAGLYELIAGERRLQAVKMLGLQKVPVIVRKVNDQEKLELALIENIQRHDLNVIEEARSFKQLHEKFALTQMEISERVGKSRSAVANTLRLLSLPMDIQRTLQEGKITEGHARSILSIENPEKQRAMLDAIVRGNLSVRQTEEKAKDVMMGKNNRSRLFGTDPELSAYEQQISAALGTKVKIKKGTHGGQIVIEYYSSEELSGLVEKLSSF